MSERYLDERQSAEKREARANAAAWQYRLAAQVAKDAGMALRAHSRIHYSLRWGRGWILHLYPSNTRIFRHKARGPYLHVPRDDDDAWTLLDVVNAAIAYKQLNTPDRSRREVDEGQEARKNGTDAHARDAGKSKSRRAQGSADQGPGTPGPAGGGAENS